MPKVVEKLFPTNNIVVIKKNFQYSQVFYVFLLTAYLLKSTLLSIDIIPFLAGDARFLRA